MLYGVYYCQSLMKILFMLPVHIIKNIVKNLEQFFFQHWFTRYWSAFTRKASSAYSVEAVIKIICICFPFCVIPLQHQYQPPWHIYIHNNISGIYSFSCVTRSSSSASANRLTTKPGFVFFLQ